MGNIAWGIPLDARHEFAGTLGSLLHPYALLMGVTTVALFMMHGAIYVVMKTEGELQAQARGWINNCIIFFIICYALSPWPPCSTCRTWPRPCATNPPCSAGRAGHARHRQHPEGNPSRTRRAGVPVLRSHHDHCDDPLWARPLPLPGLQPALSGEPPDRFITRSSSTKTLRIMLNIALIGMPVVLAYTACIYWIFRGKVRLGDNSY
jgi:cytochrome d ubiquinol oxidase subunit II